MYVITGANGHIGRKVAEILLSEGRKVRVVSRNTNRLRPLAEKGAEVCGESLQDEAFLVEAFHGATAVYVMIPPNHKPENLRAYQNRIGEAIFTALKSTTVKYVVNLTSLGAHRPDMTGPILGLYDQEQRLNWLREANLVHLRPAFFMENFLDLIPLIKAERIIRTPLKGDLAIPVIAAKDVAKVASQYLLKLDYSGILVRELLGQRDISMHEMTRILAKATGMDGLEYVRLSDEEAKSLMIEKGFSKDVSTAILELCESINDGEVIVGTGRTDQNTTATPFEEFAEVFAAAYHNS
ncbi:NmrA family NAD(P)-binding protein [Thermodesulfobacteriota bacterium]